jgi:hypothetical protein
MHLSLSTYTYVSYRIASKESSHRTQGAKRVARGAVAGGVRGRRGGR